jgi:hypothetical protein
MPRVTGLGMQITKQNGRAGVVFLSADPDTADHEIALMRGRPDATDPHLIQQISMRVGTLDDLRARSTGASSPRAIASRRSPTTPAPSAATSSIPKPIARRCSG